jgi:probable rRNA maturation factor
MTSYVSIEADDKFGFDLQEVTDLVVREVLNMEKCPYEASVNLLFTNAEEVRKLNAEYRKIDNTTDVLSFPGLHFPAPGDFSDAEQHELDCFDPDSGELLLGDIIINSEKVREQADLFNHSLKREYAFLVAHSMLHLCGYDHMKKEEAEVMEAKQEKVLQNLHITREEE